MRNCRPAVQFAAAERHLQLLIKHDVGPWGHRLVCGRNMWGFIVSRPNYMRFPDPTPYPFQESRMVLYETLHPGVWLGHRNYRRRLDSLRDCPDKRFIRHTCKPVPEQTVVMVRVVTAWFNRGSRLSICFCISIILELSSLIRRTSLDPSLFALLGWSVLFVFGPTPRSVRHTWLFEILACWSNVLYILSTIGGIRQGRNTETLW